MWTYLKNLLQLLFFPEKGWTDIICSTSSAAPVYRKFFLPMAIAASLSAFFVLLYGGIGADAVVALQRAIVCFFSFFLSYHISNLALGSIMPKLSRKEKNDPTRVAIFIAYSLSVVALITIIGNAVKVQLALIQFLPLYVAFIIWKGSKAMEVAEDKQPHFTAAASIMILGSVYLLGFCFNLFI